MVEESDVCVQILRVRRNWLYGRLLRVWKGWLDSNLR